MAATRHQGKARKNPQRIRPVASPRNLRRNRGWNIPSPSAIHQMDRSQTLSAWVIGFELVFIQKAP